MQTAEYKIIVSHWPFSDQFYCMANQLLVGIFTGVLVLNTG